MSTEWLGIVLLAVLFAAIYKVLPDRAIAWRDVIVGALITAVLFTIGKSLIGWYLGSSAVASSYGAAGGLIVLFFWVYYSAQIFFFGAEFTQVYSKLRHIPASPTENAVLCSEAEAAGEVEPPSEKATALNT